MDLNELFRRKLENSEIIPDASVNAKLMRKLAGREFLRFTPGRINIYYLGGIFVAVAVVVFLLSGGEKDSGQLPSVNFSDSLNINVRADNTTDAAFSPLKQNEGNLKDRASESVTTGQKNSHGKMQAKETIRLKEVPMKNKFMPAGVTESFSKKELFTGSTPESGKIKGRLNKEQPIFESSVAKGCSPLKIQFYNKLNGYDSCRWTFGDGGYSTSKNPEWIFDVEGDYKVVLDVFGTDGNIATSSAVITVYPKPSVSFETNPSKPLLPDDEIRFVNYSANGVKFRWDFGDGSSSDLSEPLHRYSKSGNYNLKLVVSSEFGCIDSLTVLNAFTGSEDFIDFPNAFIPNQGGPTGGFYSSKSDETAQIFHPVFSGVSEYQLKIFSKLGILIFESNDINIGWDGYYNGQVSNPGVYIWKVRGNFKNGEPFIKMGDITLLKN